MAGERLCCAQSCQTDGLPYLRSQLRATRQTQRRAQGFSFILDRNQEPCLAFAYKAHAADETGNLGTVDVGPRRRFRFRTEPWHDEVSAALLQFSYSTENLRQASTGSDYVYRTDHGSLNRRLSPGKELSLQQPGQHTPEDGQHYNASHGDTKTNDHHRIGVVVHADISAANAFSPAL